MLSHGARLARQHGASRLARRLTSRAGPNDAALARALRWCLSRPVVLRPVSKAAWRAFESEGMEKVLGIGPEVLEELRLRVDYLCMEEDDWRMSASLEHAEKKLESWGGITKGRDIFIPGMKGFDIMEAYAHLVHPACIQRGRVPPDEHWEEYENEYEYEYESEEDPWDRGRTVVGTVGETFYLPNWLVGVDELQAVGHFPALCHDRRKYIVAILALDPECPVRQHLIAYHEWWNNDENANELDELKRMAVWYDHGSSRWESDWPEGGEKLKPPILLRRLREAEARRSLGPDIHFAHLDCIADPPAEGKLALRVLRRSHDVVHIATQLGNCARSYIGRVKRGRYVLVGAFDGDKPKALAGYAAGGAGWDHPPVAFGNKNVDSGTGALFDAFLPALENWTPAAAPPEYEEEDENGDDWHEHEEEDEDDRYNLLWTRSHPDTPYCKRYKKERKD